MMTAKGENEIGSEMKQVNETHDEDQGKEKLGSFYI